MRFMAFLLLALPAGAHMGQRLYPIDYLSDEVLEQIHVDGRIDEWPDLLGEPTVTLVDFRNDFEELADPASLDFRIWLAWRDDPVRFYLAFVGSDDDYKNTYDPDRPFRSLMNFSDSIALSIDGDHSGGERCRRCYSEDMEEMYSVTQHYSGIARAVSGPLIDTGPIYGGEWTVLPPYGHAAGSVESEDPVISVIELYVTPFDSWNGWESGPEDVVFSNLTAGQVIGFGVVVRDHDPRGGGGGFMTLESVDYSDLIGLNADGLADGLLLPVDNSAVMGSTWGRIKASINH